MNEYEDNWYASSNHDRFVPWQRQEFWDNRAVERGGGEGGLNKIVRFRSKLF